MPLNADIFYEAAQDEWRQGDIVLDINIFGQEADLAILISPQCDIKFEKIDFFLFILTADFNYSFRKIIDPEELLTEDHLRGLTELSRGKLSSILSHVLRHLNGAEAHRFYYLPPYDNPEVGFTHRYIDFQRITTVPAAIFDEWKEKRSVTIADPFRAQILSRYIAYIGRIGTPDYTQEYIFQLLEHSGLRFNDKDFEDLCKKKKIP